MKRAERRRMERAAKKMVKKGNITESDVARMMREEEQRQEISHAVRVRALTDRIDKELGDKYYAQVYSEAYNDGVSDFNMDSQTVFFISFGLALKDKFPKWGPDAIESVVQGAIDWNERYIKEFGRDLDAYKLHYAMEVGRKFELEEIE